LTDVQALVVQSPGVWQRRLAMVEAAGLYEADLTPPEAGVFSLWVESPSAGLVGPAPPGLLLEARP
jgi:hypothetical protein